VTVGSGQQPPPAHSATGAGPRDSGGDRARGADLLDPRAILRRHGLRPRKRLGQHFLTDRAHLVRIVAAADLVATDIVLEVGPGLGVLTDALAQHAGHVVAVEVDPGMRHVLASTLVGRGNVEIVAADVLRVAPDELVGATDMPAGRLAGYKVVANLPYQITSAVLRHILEARVRPELAVVMVQREVAERILAAPGDMSILAVAVQFYAHPSLVDIVPAAAFYPSPQVDSAVLRLDVHAASPVGVTDVPAFFHVVRAGFGQKRKQLRNSLSAGLGITPAAAVLVLAAADIDPTRRAETLALDEWARLTRVVVSAD
jgi:16S rRNA (adenine1518-N6/adenine1519-N6)-dimethyltransferase